MVLLYYVYYTYFTQFIVKYFGIPSLIDSINQSAIQSAEPRGTDNFLFVLKTNEYRSILFTALLLLIPLSVSGRGLGGAHGKPGGLNTVNYNAI